MKVGKPKSKRVPVRLRHRIEKSSAAKQRKQRKEAKKNPQWRSRLKKDPGIPNLFPYKAKVLAEIEEGKRKKAEEVQRRRDVAKAQKQGIAAALVVDPDVVEPAAAGAGVAEEDGDEELLDQDEDVGEDDEMADDTNPMAALLASAQTRAQAYTQDDDDDEGAADGDEEDEWDGIEEGNIHPAPGQATRKVLPKQALADPIKAVSALLDRMQQTADGIQRLIDHYQVLPLVTAGTDMTSSFLVEVARKRGRLGRGGVPNLHSAALVVLDDLNEERLNLPAVAESKTPTAIGKGGVQIVSQLAEPFKIDGLWGGGLAKGGMDTDQMAIVA